MFTSFFEPNLRETALIAIEKATFFAKKFQKELHPDDIIQKEDLSLVTVADFVCQFLINEHLLKTCPNIPLMAEENTTLLKKRAQFKDRVIAETQKIYPHITENEILEIIDAGDYEGDSKKVFWVIDPIDGTRGYANRDQYAIALALIEDGKPVLGGLGCPDLPGLEGSIFFSVKGEGTQIKLPHTTIMTKIQESQLTEIIYCEQTFASKKHSHAMAEAIVKQVHAHAKPFRIDSQCKYALVAANEASIYLRVPNSASEEKIWDHAPGTIVVEEAGGIVTDLRGHPLDFSQGKTLRGNFGIVASSLSIHSKIIKATKRFC